MDVISEDQQLPDIYIVFTCVPMPRLLE